MSTVKVYEYQEQDMDCTDMVVGDVIYPFLTEAVQNRPHIQDFSPYQSYPLKDNLPDHAVLAYEYELEG